jgi:hypothetical protein
MYSVPFCLEASHEEALPVAWVVGGDVGLAGRVA